MKVNVLDIKAKKVGEIELSDSVFGVEYNEPLIHQVIVAQLANRRQGTKCTLTRTEVRGGGKKPWRQKGTGRARQGSIRSPQWTGGGVVFAPKPRDFSQKINKKMKSAATLSALSAKVSDNDFIVLDKLVLEEAKTKYVAQMLKAFEIDKKVLLVVGNDDANVLRACANIPNLTLINADLINVYDLAANAKCIFTVDAVNKIEEAYKNE
ncbi:MAG: 50S ribosomal protein L4 [Clostridia bacterium]|jgi:large subunit ribosomal protein L4|nr:50S ribosomal protein L4 [Clostridia bacterium]MCI8945240.1 50S ribosomal protein L4 [Clostridia bacterium]MCI9291571.1 50S ribosomal protein L4 [Clostridia bacterium]MDE6884636.1 50S ribosomal protein L4 [Clostridia bacterium]